MWGYKLNNNITMSGTGPPPPPPGGQVVNPTLGKDREKLPGWNDPPELLQLSQSVQLSSGAAAAPRTKLNKRVGYVPASGPASTSNCGGAGFVLPLSTPPIIQVNLPPPPPAVTTDPDVNNFIPAKNVTSNPEITSEIEVPDIKSITDQLNGVLDELGSGPDVRKRVAVMQSKWDSLDDKVKAGVGQLSSHLLAGNHEEAERVQKALAISYPSQCAAWIMAFKRLVNDAKAKRGQVVVEDGKNLQATTGYMVPADN